MHEFNSIQEVLNQLFEDMNINVINIPGSPYPWFIVDEIRKALGYVRDNFDFTKNLNFRDQVIAVLNLSNITQINNPMNHGLMNYIKSLSPKARNFMIISLPGLFELLLKSRMPKAKELQHWLYFTVLPTLYHFNQQQLNKQI